MNGRIAEEEVCNKVIDVEAVEKSINIYMKHYVTVNVRIIVSDLT